MHQDVDTTSIRDILTRHGVPKNHHGEFEYLVDTGLIDSQSFSLALHTDYRYMAACEEVMEALSRPFYRLRPPTPSHFVSLSRDGAPPTESLYEQ